MSSILTNQGAMVALQTLQKTNKNMNQVQSQVSTGMRVANAKDNSSSWAIASTMRGDTAMMKSLSNSLTANSAMVAVARSASEQIVEKLREVQERVALAQNPDADTGKLDAEITEIMATITSIAESAQFNGINLVGSTGASQTITVAITRDAAGAVDTETFSVAAEDLSAFTLSTASTLDEVETDLQTAIDAAAAFGAAQQRIEAQNEFLKSQIQSLELGVGALVDADMEEASARLQALQVQQQLGIQALSIANQQPQSILSLFR